MKTLVAYLQDGLVAALTRVLATVRLCPPCLRTPAGLRVFVHSLFSALFIACLIHTWPALVLPVDLPLRTIIGNIASWAPPPDSAPDTAADARTPLRDLALIKLDGERLRSTYHGNSPLNRCALLQDLRGLLASRTLQLLAIDLDLSPSTQRAMRSKAEDAGSCDAQLDQLMIDNARRVLLILPLDRDRLRADRGPAEAAEQAAQKAWLNNMTTKQLRFARPELDLQFGMLRHHLLQPAPGLGVAMAQGICKLAATDPSLVHYCRRVARLDAAALRGEARQISLHVLVKQLPLRNRLLLDGQTGTVLDDRKIRYALLGAGYSADDEPLTPIGRLAGVEVHAAIAANPNEAASHLFDLLFDVVLGVVFACFVHFFWRHYFKQRLAVKEQKVSERGHPLLAYRWLVGLVLSSLVLLPLLGVASTWALATHGWWISPAGMLVGVLIDAFVIGGVHNAEHLLLDAADAVAPPTPGGPALAIGPTPVPTPAQRARQVPAEPDTAAQTAPDSTAYWQGAHGWVRCGLAWLPSLVWLAALVQAGCYLAH